MAKVLLINPSYRGSYGGAKASIVNPIFPTLALATISATARERGHEIHIMDLSWSIYDYNYIKQEILRLKPDIIGIHATTPNMNQARDISILAKDISKDILMVAGGPHPSALPEESLRESYLDAVVVGEGDYTFAELCDGDNFKDIKGLYYRVGDEILSTGPRLPIANLDDLPLPAWDLYDLDIYVKYLSKLFARRAPFVTAEFSRGCVFKCDFCASKQTMALGYRKKSPERCAEEVKYMKTLGIREFMVADDIFTSDAKWATKVSQAIAEANTGILWTCTNGIRVESAKAPLFKTMKEAGCYRVSFGFESGNEEVLKSFGKGGTATLEQGANAVNTARKAGIETNGFFMLGLSGDTESTMMDTIEFARSLPLDILKFGITIPFPGTPMFRDYSHKGIVKSYNWDDYHMYSPVNLFTHPTIGDNEINKMMEKAYQKAILLNLPFVFRRMKRGVTTGEFFWDMYYFFKFLLMPTVGKHSNLNYYARDRWPTLDYYKTPPSYHEPQKVVKATIG